AVRAAVATRGSTGIGRVGAVRVRRRHVALGIEQRRGGQRQLPATAVLLLLLVQLVVVVDGEGRVGVQHAMQGGRLGLDEARRHGHGDGRDGRLDGHERRRGDLGGDLRVHGVRRLDGLDSLGLAGSGKGGGGSRQGCGRGGHGREEDAGNGAVRPWLWCWLLLCHESTWWWWRMAELSLLLLQEHKLGERGRRSISGSSAGVGGRRRNQERGGEHRACAGRRRGRVSQWACARPQRRQHVPEGHGRRCCCCCCCSCGC
ncbi:hypothetical protein BC831DRAFT_467562, partial [Entophlyctis helioformis]